jgi:hypothetical protein
MLIQHPHGFPAGTTPVQARKELLSQAKSHSSDDYTTTSSGSVNRLIKIHDVWEDAVEVYTTYQCCAGMKKCPHFKMDYNPATDYESTEEERHEKRVAKLSKQTTDEEKLPFKKTIAYVSLVS